MSARVFFLSSIVTLGTGGCAGTVHHHRQHHHTASGVDAVIVGFGVLAGVAAIADAQPPPPPEPVVVQQTIYVNGSPPAEGAPAPLPPPRDRGVESAPSAPPFDAKRARTALTDVDLSACRAAGAPRGYGHATVTFNPDGASSKVVVDTPAGLPASAVRCIGDKLGAVTVPEYAGSLVAVGTTWFVPETSA